MQSEVRYQRNGFHQNFPHNAIFWRFGRTTTRRTAAGRRLLDDEETVFGEGLLQHRLSPGDDVGIVEGVDGGCGPILSSRDSAASGSVSRQRKDQSRKLRHA